MPFKVFTNGVPLPASDLNDYLMEQSIATFANSAARTAAITSPNEGQVVYLADTDSFEFWTGSLWAGFGSSQTLISTTSLTASTTTLSSIPSNYTNLRLVIRQLRPVTDAITYSLRINGISTSSYYQNDPGTRNSSTFGSTSFTLSTAIDNGASNSLMVIDFPDYANTGTWRIGKSLVVTNNATAPTAANLIEQMLVANITDPISSISLITSTGNITSGTALLYGVR